MRGSVVDSSGQEDEEESAWRMVKEVKKGKAGMKDYHDEVIFHNHHRPMIIITLIEGHVQVPQSTRQDV